MKKKLFLMTLACTFAVTNGVKADVLDPYAPEKGASWCQKSTESVDKSTKSADQTTSKSKGPFKKIVIITTLALITLCIAMGSSSNAIDRGPTT
jgi:hypothetical protein